MNGYIHRNELDLSLSKIVMDLPFMAELITIPEFSITGGTGTGNLRIYGSPKDPEFSALSSERTHTRKRDSSRKRSARIRGVSNSAERR
jgi:hypothetical protein